MIDQEILFIACSEKGQVHLGSVIDNMPSIYGMPN